MVTNSAANLFSLLAVYCTVLAQAPTFDSSDTLASTIAPSLPSSEKRLPGKDTGVGRLVIMLFDADSGEQPGVYTRVVLYDGTNMPLAQEQANSSATATFESVPAGTGYHCLAYAGASSVWGEELWGEKAEISVASGETTYEMIRRNMPSIGAVHLYLDDSGTPLPEQGRMIIRPGTMLRVELDIQEPEVVGGHSVSILGSCALDRDARAPFDVHMTQEPESPASGMNRRVRFLCEAPAMPGEYHLSAGLYAFSSRYQLTLTDGTDWGNPPFRIPDVHIPFIVSLRPVKAKAGDVVTIEGGNFSPNPTKNTVYFGPVRASVVDANADVLETIVPVGSGADFVTVTVDGLTARSPGPFELTFDGTGEINATSFSPPAEFGATALLRQGTVADLDGDGKPDLAESSDNHAAAIYRNTSSPGVLSTASFDTGILFPVGKRPYQLEKADIDGDGKLDLVNANNSGGSFTVLRNTSLPGMLSFARLDIPALGVPQCLAVADLDDDGRPDVAITGAAPIGVAFFLNTSTIGTVSFAQGIGLGTGRGCTGIAIADIDGDGRGDVIVANGIGTEQERGSLTMYRNLSSPGELRLAPGVEFPCGQYARAIAVADLDNDQKIDVILSVGTDSDAPEKLISLYRNTSTPGILTFATRMDLQSGTPWFVAVGDLNGDGRADIAAPSSTSSSITVFENLSTTGQFAFGERVDFPTRGDPFSVHIVDLDGDGIPDLSAASYGGMGVAVLRNTMMTPPVSPAEK
ncbi:MAG: VCBS repeat-containing protein [Bacteroidetes bacterium]|nr:VCBS repeat-containing protein [Bacteroidota bacterium]